MWYILSGGQFGSILAKDLKIFKSCQITIPFLGIYHKRVIKDSCKDACTRLIMSVFHTTYSEGKKGEIFFFQLIIKST